MKCYGNTACLHAKQIDTDLWWLAIRHAAPFSRFFAPFAEQVASAEPQLRKIHARCGGDAPTPRRTSSVTHDGSIGLRVWGVPSENRKWLPDILATHPPSTMVGKLCPPTYTHTHPQFLTLKLQTDPLLSRYVLSYGFPARFPEIQPIPFNSLAHRSSG